MNTKHLNIIVAIAALCSCMLIIYMGVNHMKWKEANCEKVYYETTIRVCAQTQRKLMTAGKVTYFQQVCIKHKDTVVQRWRYKCPTKN